MEQKNAMMNAINSMKAALSEIEKECTMQQGVKIDGPQDGNTGTANAEGEVDFEKFANLSKKKKLLEAMAE